MTWDAKRHWRMLTLASLAVLAAGFLLPKAVKAPIVHENRQLAEAPPAPRTWAELRAWPKAMDAYVSDRFPARAHLIGGLNYLRYLAGVSGTDRVIVGRGGWLFYNGGNHLAAARNDPPYGDPEARDWLLGLAGRTEWLEARGARYLLLVGSDKEVVAPQHGPAWFQGPDPDRPAALLARLNAQARAGAVVYPAAELQQQAQRGLNVYNPVETHWTGLGAYTAYAALMRRLQEMGVGEGPRPLSAFRRAPDHPFKPRNLSLMLGIASFVDADYPEFEDPAATPKITYLTADKAWTAPQVIDTGATGKPVLFLMRDSFSLALIPFLQGDFSRIVLVHIQDGAWRPELVERFEPDVVVTEVIESGVQHMMSGSPPASPAARARIEEALAAPHRAAAGPGRG